MELIDAILLLGFTFGLSMATGVMLERDKMIFALPLALISMIALILILSKIPFHQ